MGAGDHRYHQAVDVTASRAVSTTYTNGANRRTAYVSVICTATVSGQAYAGYTTTIGGTSLSMPTIVGDGSGVALATRHLLVIPIDPGATYSVTTSLGTGATVTIQQWVEVDE